jgi:hypothetical protein
MARGSRSLIAEYEQRLLSTEWAGTAPDRQLSVARPRVRPAVRPPRKRSTVRARRRRIFALTLVFVLGYVSIAFVSAMSAPSNVPFGLRAIEWMRDNGAAWLVSDIERYYYSWNAPSTGGAALKRLPKVGVTGTGAAAAYQPAPIPPVISPALPGEGQWHGTGPLVRGAPPVLVTTVRPDPNYPQMVAGVAWIDSTRAWLQLYPGRYEPPNAGTALAEVPTQLRAALLATFNSGFKLEDNGGGFVAFGHVYAPLRDGQGTLIRYRNGTADVISWTGGPDPGPNVEFARQNLPLIVDDGQLNPNLQDGPEWGATLGNAVRVWRSGVGIDVRGNVIYAAADNQTAQSLAEILQRAGAVRAMELDINSEWVTFNSYAIWNAGAPQKLLPDMTRDATRYLTPDDRDFVAVYARR